MIRAFLKDGVIYAIPTIASKGLALFLVPLYTRILSPADYGSFDLFNAFASVVSLTIALEISQGVARFYQQEPSPERRMLYASSAFWFSLFMHTGFALFMLAASPYVADLVMGRSGLQPIFILGLVQIWVSSILLMVQGQLRWQLRSAHYATVNLVTVFVSALVSVWLTVFIGWGLAGLIMGTIVGAALASVLGLWWLRDSLGFKVDRGVLLEMLRFSAPLVFSSMAVWVNLYVDRLMISHFFSVDEVGLYGIAFRMASIAGLLLVAFQGALGPLIYAHFTEERTPKDLARIFRLFLFLALGCWIALSAFSVDVLRIMTTPEYYSSAIFVPLLVPAIMLSGMYIFAPGLAIAKLTHLFVWINLGGAVANWLLNLTLIPMIGVAGAAVATLISNAIVFSAYLILGQAEYPIPHKWAALLVSTAMAAAIVSTTPALPADDLARWSIGGAFLIGFSLVSVLCGLIPLSEIKSGWRAARAIAAR